MLKIRSICTTLTGGKIYNINGRIIREEKLLSEGAYSFVYVAKDLNTNKVFTLKKTLCQDKEKLEMANKEINILKSLPPHKNIVQYYGSTIISENNYKVVIMLMEYCERGNLLNIFERHKDKIKEHHVVKILKDIITGINFLHNQETPITHRDIKLENILCDKNGVYKICDLGSHSVSKPIYPNDLMKNSINKLKEEIERDTTLIYRPPELVDLYYNLEISPKVDIWMFGCILYLLLFKAHPFQNNSFLSILNGSYTIPCNIKISKRIISILLMTLNKDPLIRVDSSTLLFIFENYSDLKKWFSHIPIDIKKKVNRIFDKINELVANGNHNNVIEINNDKILDFKVVSQKFEPHIPPKNNINFLKFFSNNNSISSTLKKSENVNHTESKAAAGTESISPVENTKGDAMERKDENTDNNTVSNIVSNTIINDISKISKNSKDSSTSDKNPKDSNKDTHLEKNVEAKIENNIAEHTIENKERTKNESDDITNEYKQNQNLLNLSIELDETMEHHENKISYKENDNILNDLNQNKGNNLFYFNDDNNIEENEQYNINNFDNFFDPWNSTKNNDFIEVDTITQKNSDNYFFEKIKDYPISTDLFESVDKYSSLNNDMFEMDKTCTTSNSFLENGIDSIKSSGYILDDKSQRFRYTCYSTSNFNNHFGSLNCKNSKNINNAADNITNFEGIQDKGAKCEEFNKMAETNIDFNLGYNNNNNNNNDVEILNNINNKNNFQFVDPDKKDKFSELLYEFQKFSVK